MTTSESNLRSRPDWRGPILQARRLLFACLLAMGLTHPLAAQALLDGTVVAGASQTLHDLRGFRYGSLEYRLPLKWPRLSVLTGLEWNGDDRYATVGVFLTLAEGRRFRLGIGSGPGFMNRGKSLLGSELEFRSFAELQLLISPRFSWGVDICHYSNGGISAVNPGAESVRFFLAWKLGRPAVDSRTDELHCSQSFRPQLARPFTLLH